MSPGRIGQALALILVLGLSGFPVPASMAAVAFPPAPSSPTPRTSLPAIEQEVMCPVCGVPLNLAESPQAERERAFIRGLIAQGQTKDQIKHALVSEFGSAVLALPSQHGFNLAVYLVPAVVVGALAMIAAAMLPRWRRRGVAAGLAGPTPSLSPGDSGRLEDDLARYDR